MQIFTFKTIALGLAAGLLAAGVYAQTSGKNCTIGTDGMMQCGMGMPTPQIDTEPSLAASTTHALKITATMPAPAQSGDNPLGIVITNATGKPITGAKVTAQVAMTSMDMGTDTPKVKEVGKGHYSTTVAFSMSGPWRVTLKVTAPGQKPQSKSFDFTAN